MSDEQTSRSKWVTRGRRHLEVVVVVLVAVWVAGNVEWSQVGDAFKAVSSVEFGVLIGLVVIRPWLATAVEPNVARTLGRVNTECCVRLGRFVPCAMVVTSP